MAKNQLVAKVTLFGDRVDNENDQWLNYTFPKNQQKKAFEIVKSSLYPYPVTNIEANKDRSVTATLKGPIKVFQEASYTDTGNIYLNIVEDLAYNYGDGGPDGWMEGDIYIDDSHELWLALSKVEFYQNGQLELLFDDADLLDSMGSLGYRMGK